MFSYLFCLILQDQYVVKSMIIRLVLTLCLGEVGGMAVSPVLTSQSVGLRALPIFSNILVTGPEMLCDPPVPIQVQLPRFDYVCYKSSSSSVF